VNEFIPPLSLSLRSCRPQNVSEASHLVRCRQVFRSQLVHNAK
jgi:hypothetical protein